MKPEVETYIIKDMSLFDRLVRYEQQVPGDLMVYDVETNSEQEVLAELYGFGICFSDKKAFYVPWRDKHGSVIWNAGQIDLIVKWLQQVASRRKLIGHNIIYDVLVTEKNLGIDLTDFVYSDTLLQKHTLDEEPPFALKEIAIVELGEWSCNS
jgi:DNA polymerase I-like protein with 3'-5' exonuclease and polymerase domains